MFYSENDLRNTMLIVAGVLLTIGCVVGACLVLAIQRLIAE